MTFTSGLSIPDFAALDGVGLTAVGQVTAAVAVRLGNVPYACKLRRPSGQLVRSWSLTDTTEATELEFALRQARGTVMDRLREGATRLGADGIVDTTVEQDLGEQRHNRRRSSSVPFRMTGRMLRFRVTGTAVRWRDPAHQHAKELFTCDLSGRDVALLVHSGQVPTRLTWGFGVAMGHGASTASFSSNLWGSRGAGDREMTAASDLLKRARDLARKDLQQELVGTPSWTMVLQDENLQTWDEEPARDHRHVFALASYIGSGVAREGASAPLGAQPVMALGTGLAAPLGVTTP